MAETHFYTTINHPQLPPNPTKFYTHFLYKAIFVSIFLLLLPLFPSQAPDFINHTINTTSWELLQLLFVGIAVSYGLFSKRTNDETDNQQGSTKSPDNAHSYVAGLLQVSSVFDDDSETPSGSEDNTKLQTWNSQYYRGEPIVVVAKESSEHTAGDARTIEKPLLLPVRSLKNRVSESSMIDSKVNSFSRSNSRRFSRNFSKSSGVSPEESEEKPEENIVFRSPIPWRSRSGRMEVKEDVETPPQFSPTPSVQDSSETNHIESHSFRYQSSKSSKPVSNPLSHDKVHPSLSSEIQSKSLEDVGRKKITPKSSSFSPIPPPPPPPPPVNLNYTHNRINNYSGKEFRRNARSFTKEFSEDLQNRGRRGAEFTIRTRSDTSSGAKSFRTPKESEFNEYLSHDEEIESFLERRGSQNKKFMNENTQTFMEYPKEEKKEFMETGKDSDESEEEDDELVELASKNNGEMVGKDYSDNGPDVDKKADEFIAKFREQIRLQRIASIRRSTAQSPKNGGLG